MTDRGPAPDASPACPFVAFEDDRDGRSTRADHRHRCFAELRPAPRASAHQEAYCLSAGFAACPTFVDWARREAARVRPTGDAPAPTPPPASTPTPPPASVAPPPPLVVPPPATPPAASDDQGIPRDARRYWAAPPPWVAPSAGAAAGAAAGSEPVPAPADWEAPAPEREPARPEPADLGLTDLEPADLEPPRPTPPVEAPSFLASRSASTRAAYPPADLDDELESAAAPDEWAELDPEEPPMRRFGPAAGHARYDDTHTTADRPAARRRPPADPDAPSWEKPRRFEAYPTLRTRTGLSGVSPLLLAGVAILLVAAALFFLPPILLDLGGDPGATPTPSASGATSSATPVGSPSPSPAPTPLVYVVKQGDTLSSIAAEFEVSLDDLIAANAATLPDPDKLDIGDRLIIPIGGFEPSPSPSPALPEASPSP